MIRSYAVLTLGFEFGRLNTKGREPLAHSSSGQHRRKRVWNEASGGGGEHNTPLEALHCSETANQGQRAAMVLTCLPAIFPRSCMMRALLINRL